VGLIHHELSLLPPANDADRPGWGRRPGVGPVSAAWLRSAEKRPSPDLSTARAAARANVPFVRGDPASRRNVEHAIRCSTSQIRNDLEARRGGRHRGFESSTQRRSVVGCRRLGPRGRRAPSRMTLGLLDRHVSRRGGERDQGAPRRNAELAVDAARVRADRLDPICRATAICAFDSPCRSSIRTSPRGGQQRVPDLRSVRIGGPSGISCNPRARDGSR